jgi:hypothetical protein
MLRLDPALPVLWRTPTCVQIGVDPALCVLPDVSAALEVLLSALAEGCDREHLDDLADRRSLPAFAVQRLLDVVAPALERPPAAAELPPIDGPADLVRELTRRLAPLGPPPGGHPVADPVVLAAHHVLPPVRWIARLS